MEAALLEEVFNEVDSLENSTEKISNNSKPLGFLEDLLSFDENALSSNKKQKKEKVTRNQQSTTEYSQDIKSVIHDGLTDSSDEEDNKYFEERKYNEYGKIIKDIIKKKNISTDCPIKEILNSNTKLATSQSTKDSLKAQLSKFIEGGETNKWSATSKGDLLVDPILGMRIINPILSMSSLKDKMVGRNSVSILKIKQFVETKVSKECDWVTGGAVVSNTTRVSQKGNQYCIWSLTDLNGDIKFISVLLFGSAYKEYWKTSLGTVIGILNPVVLENKEKFEAVLRVDNAKSILILGKSKDYGICKSMKKNGEPCSSVINKAKCDFCTYHLKKEYNKACRRSDLQPPKIGRSLDTLKTKLFGKKGVVLYGGMAFNLGSGEKNSKKAQADKKKLELLSQNQALSSSQTNRDKNILSKLNLSTKPVDSHTKDIQTPLKMSETMVDLNFSISKKDRSLAKANALKYIKQHGPLKMVSDMSRKVKTPEQINSLKRKLESEEEKEIKKTKTSETPLKEKNPVNEKLRKNGITDKFLQLMNSQPRNNDLLKIAETEEDKKYFEKLEVKEKIEDKMASTFKVECKAVRCLKCNYKSFSASELCKKEKHPLKVVNAVKRFWKCGNCSHRTVCLELIPLHSCKTCGSSKWERTSMMPEKKDNNLNVEPLSLRGHEEKYIGATIKNANLNLLVPEDTS